MFSKAVQTMKLTKNLSRSEFACHCGCGFDTSDYVLAIELQGIVDHFQDKSPDMDVRIHINSGSRCAEHNKAVGGSAKSQHLEGKAADFYLYDKKTGDKIEPDEVHDYLMRHFPNTHGIGKYSGRTHFDSRDSMARW